MRSKQTDVLISIFCGFFLSFLLMLAAPFLTGSYGAQLIAGDPETNRQFPTTLTMMHAAMDGSDPIAQGLGSLGWWMTCTILTIIFAMALFRLLRRYV